MLRYTSLGNNETTYFTKEYAATNSHTMKNGYATMKTNVARERVLNWR